MEFCPYMHREETDWHLLTNRIALNLRRQPIRKYIKEKTLIIQKIKKKLTKGGFYVGLPTMEEQWRHNYKHICNIYGYKMHVIIFLMTTYAR